VTDDAGKPSPAAKRRPAGRAGRRRQAPLQTAPPDGVDPRLNHLIARDRADRVLALGLRRLWVGDLYHRILTVGWCGFFLGGAVLYVVANTVFALLYLVQPGAISGARSGAFADAFFFSVETMATIGYGQMAPATLYANVLMTVESAFGLMVVALSTGMVFARFSRPTARVLFSEVAVIGPQDGKRTLTVRLANERQNQILAAEVTMTLIRDELSLEGDLRRRFYDLNLVRHRSPVFALTFSVMHVIDPGSPLYEGSAATLAAANAELVVTATGIDETLAQTVHARTSYLTHEILWDRRFTNILGWTEDGQRAIDYRLFHDTTRLDEET
jgi:inward rectifier potassium channel